MFPHRKRRHHLLVVLTVVLSAFVGSGCGDDSSTNAVIDEVLYGETAFVVVLNPSVNDANEASMASPGSVRSGVTVSVEGGPSAVTDGDGIAVLAPVAPGTRTLSITGGGIASDVTLEISEGDLREVAIAADGNGAEVMANVRYAFGGTVTEVTASMSEAEVNTALSQSNTIVFFEAGTYSGDLEFSGSSVTLFGQGSRGGNVTINGNVLVDGSSNRLRGAIVTGDLSIAGSNAGLSFGRIHGTFDLSGSDATLLGNQFCGAAAVTGSQPRLLDNGGLAPIAAKGC